MVVLMAAFCTCVLCYFFMDTHPKKKVEKKKNLISVGFAQVGAESDWRTANSISIKKTFAESKGYDLLFEDARQMQENQIKSMREFIQQDVDYIVVAPVIEEGFETVLEEASRAKIPVIVIDRKVSVSDNNLYTTWIGSDFYLQGKKACECLNQYITQKGMKDVNIVRYSARKKKIAYLNTLPISSVEKAYLMKQSDRYYRSSDKSLKKAIKSSSMSEEDKKQIYSYLRLGR